MRTKHRIVLIGLLIGLLSPCLTFMEYPEFQGLHDDPSNAFILEADSARSSVILDFQVTKKNETGKCAPILANCPEPVAALDCSSIHQPEDLQALYSLRRT